MKNSKDETSKSRVNNEHLEKRNGIVKGNFVELSKIDSGMVVSYYECRHCGRRADTRHERPECHTCADWGGCNYDCTLSHLVCEYCNIVQKIWSKIKFIEKMQLTINTKHELMI